MSSCSPSLVAVLCEKGILPLLTAVFSASTFRCAGVFESLYQGLSALLDARPVVAAKRTGLQVCAPSLALDTSRNLRVAAWFSA